MKRRGVLTTLGATIVVFPYAINAQRAAEMHRIGLLAFKGTAPDGPFGGALVRGLARRGYELDHNYSLVGLATRSRAEQVPQLIDELVASKVDVIVAFGYPPAVAAKQGTSLPVVVAFAGDPISTGLVGSLARPEGHVTGITDLSVEITPKRLQLLREMAPGLRRIAVLWNAADPGMTSRYRASQAGAEAMGISVQPLGVREPDDFEQAFATMSRDMPDGLLMVTDTLTDLRRMSVYAFALAHRLPGMYETDGYVREGGLMSYGPDLDASFDSVAALVERILKGAKPSELPFEQPTLFRFVINLRAAKAIGLTLPPTVLGLADEVIE